MLLRTLYPVAVLGFLLLPGCGKKVVTSKLSPSQVMTRTNWEQLWCQTVETLPGALKPPSANAMLVGYRNWELGAGTACRGFVKFDLSSLPSTDVLAATLRWIHTTQRVDGTVAANHPVCTKSMFIANEAWTKFQISGDQLAGETFDEPVAVGATVREWAEGERANHGFFFAGPENLIVEGNADYCLTLMRDFELEVVTAVPESA